MGNVRTGNPLQTLARNAEYLKECHPHVYRQISPYLAPNAIRIARESGGRIAIQHVANGSIQRSLPLMNAEIHAQSERRIQELKTQELTGKEGILLSPILSVRELIEPVQRSQQTLVGLIAAEPDPLRLVGPLMQQDIIGVLQLPWVALFAGDATSEEIEEAIRQKGLGCFDPWLEITKPTDTDNNLAQAIKDAIARIRENQKSIESAVVSAPSIKPTGKPKRMLIVDSWRKTPNTLHLQAIEASLKQRGIETHRLVMDCLDQAPHTFHDLTECYKYWLLPKIHEFKPDWILSHKHHSFQYLTESIYEKAQLPWIILQTSLYPNKPPYGPNTIQFVTERTMIPLLKGMGAPEAFFLPLAADYYSSEPPTSDPQFTISLVGGCTLPSEDKFAQFREKLKPYGDLYDRLSALAEERIDNCTYFSTWDMEDDPILAPLPEALRKEAAQFLFWWIGGTWRLQSALAVQDRGLALWGYNWPNIAPASFLQKCWKGLFNNSELTQTIYQQSFISLNSLSPGFLTGANMTYFNVPAANCMLVTQEGPDFQDYYDRNSEIAVYKTPKDLPEIVDRLLSNPEETRERIVRSNRRVAREHLYEHRVDEMLSLLENTYS